jgi:hypothetical protein
MKYFRATINIMRLLLIFISLGFYTVSLHAQTSDTTSKPLIINGSVGVTNNGISIIPTFSLNAPASIFNFSIRKNRLSFDPDIRATLDGKKGGMLFWFRYKFIQDKKFNLSAGVHPAYNFALRTITENGKTWQITQARRFIAYEIAPSFVVSKHLSFAPYLLRGMGLQKDGPVSTYFLALNTNISNLALGNDLRFSWTPQFYYLYLDGQEGFYMANFLRLSHKKSPFSLQSVMNKEIKTNLVGSKNFVWNLILSYSFGHQYVRK